MIRLIAAVRSTLIVSALLFGAPVLLFALAGSPIPRHRPSALQLETWLDNPLNPVYKDEVARTLAWILWALLSMIICTVLALHLRIGRWSKVINYLPPPMQSLTAAVLGTAAVTASTANLAASPQTASIPIADTHHLDMQRPTHSAADLVESMDKTGEARQPATAIYLHPTTRPLSATKHPRALRLTRTTDSLRTVGAAITPARRTSPSQPAPAVRDQSGPRYHVVKGDTLWRVAETKLGSPTRWREIYTLNRGHEQADGYALTDPDEIHIGWDLALPAHHTTPVYTHKSPPASPPPSRTGAIEPAPGPRTSTASPSPAVNAPVPTAATPSAPTAPVTTAASAAPSTGSSAEVIPTEQDTPATALATPESGSDTAENGHAAGVSLPSQGWVSLGLAALIAAVASMLRLQQRRRARLNFPIAARITAQATPVPESLAVVDAVGARHLPADDEPHRPTAPAVPAPIGIDTAGNEVSLFDLPGPGLALTGDGAEPAARAVLAATLATGITAAADARPVVVTTTEILARLLPDGAPLVGLDFDATSYDGERLIVLSDAAAAVTHAEEEMIVRRRLLDTFDFESITALNERTDHAEAQPPYILLIEVTPRHAARLRAVGAHQAALHLHPIIVGPLDGLPTADIAADGTVTGGDLTRLVRLSTLAADDLAAVLAMLTDVAPRPEPGHDIDFDPAPSDPAAALSTTPDEANEDAPARAGATAAPVRLRVLGPLLVETQAGPVTTGMRSGSYTVLASLAVHPGGRTLDQLAADLHPDTEPGTAGKRIRTDISTTRRVLRTATGVKEPKFVNYDPATGRYRLDPDLITVDLWQMLTAIKTANNADDDTTALAALREAAELYGGDFADGGDQTWMSEHANSYRHQILAVYARIAEIIETNHPDQAAAALEQALEFDPVNEELNQRVMRIHGRAGRPDAVRRILRRLEERLADLGDAEPSEATRRVAERQLRQATTSGARS